MKKIILTFSLIIFAFSLTLFSAPKKNERFLKKCNDDCMSKRTRCVKEGNHGKNRLYTRGYCDSNYRNCTHDCQSRYGGGK